MTKPRKPRLKKTPLHGGDHVQLSISTAPASPALMTIVYEHEGQRCTSVGAAEQGIPVPAGAKVISYEVKA
jgi:hypothetical protein